MPARTSPTTSDPVSVGEMIEIVTVDAAVDWAALPPPRSMGIMPRAGKM